MVRYQRSARAKYGKFPEAVQLSKAMTEYINTKCSPLSLQAYATVFGDVGTLYWYVDLKDFASYESLQRQVRSDQGYWAILNKGAELFIEGSYHDTLMSSVP
ncbi:MAG: DUF6039 family protein [Syntrophobacteraceae bacterium]|jgi:hypothetical protein